MTRHGNTAQQMKTDGAWGKVGRKHYRHVSGAEITYNCNAWGWVATNLPGRMFDALWVAKLECERDAAKTQTVEEMFA